MQGICFIEPLSHKVVSGEKEQTRRIIKPQPDDNGLWDDDKYPRSLNSDLTGWNGTVAETGESKEFKPRYKLGEILYLKEPYSVLTVEHDFSMEIELQYSNIVKHINRNSIPKSDSELDKWIEKRFIEMVKSQSGFCNKLFMPEWCAENFIEITGVRAERLQEISENDCIREGIEVYNCYYEDYIGTELCSYRNGIEDGFELPQEAYAALIDSIHKKSVWNSNPFVWCYDFKLTDKK